MGKALPDWVTTLLGWLLQLGENLATLAVFVSLGAAAYSYWGRTLGRRRALAALVTSLAPTMQVEYFIERLGTPAFRRSGDDQEDLVWVHPDAFIRAVCENGTVTVYAVTTRTERFRPRFMRKLSMEVELGHTQFGALPFGPQRVYGGMGARRWGYCEVFYYGNPGGYLTYVYALNDAGWLPASSSGLLRALAQHPEVDACVTTSATDALPELHENLIQERRTAAFNTFAIVAPHASVERLDELGMTPGADRDLVRLAIYTGGLNWIAALRLRSNRRMTRN